MDSQRTSTKGQTAVEEVLKGEPQELRVKSEAETANSTGNSVGNEQEFINTVTALSLRQIERKKKIYDQEKEEHLQQVRNVHVYDEIFIYDTQDPIFDLKNEQKEAVGFDKDFIADNAKATSCYICTLSIKKEKICNFCALRSCRDCCYSKRAYPKQELLGGDVEPAKGRICKVCDRKFQMQALSLKEIPPFLEADKKLTLAITNYQLRVQQAAEIESKVNKLVVREQCDSVTISRERNNLEEELKGYTDTQELAGKQKEQVEVDIKTYTDQFLTMLKEANALELEFQNLVTQVEKLEDESSHKQSKKEKSQPKLSQRQRLDTVDELNESIRTSVASQAYKSKEVEVVPEDLKRSLPNHEIYMPKDDEEIDDGLIARETYESFASNSHYESNTTKKSSSKKEQLALEKKKQLNQAKEKDACCKACTIF